MQNNYLKSFSWMSNASKLVSAETLFVKLYFSFNWENKGTTTKQVLTAVDSSCSWDTTSTSQAAFVFNCSSTKTNNRHLFALQNASLRERISIIHVSKCVCLRKKKRGGSFSFFQFICTNGFQASPQSGSCCVVDASARTRRDAHSQ